jgi:tetratricopeptide (TPR) repeat protein
MASCAGQKQNAGVAPLMQRAEQIIRFMVERWPAHADSYLLIADIYHRRNKKAEAIQLLNDALSTKGMTAKDRFRLSAKLRELRKNQ